MAAVAGRLGQGVIGWQATFPHGLEHAALWEGLQLSGLHVGEPSALQGLGGEVGGVDVGAISKLDQAAPARPRGGWVCTVRSQAGACQRDRVSPDRPRG